jgi:hypothetical protein
MTNDGEGMRMIDTEPASNDIVFFGRDGRRELLRITPTGFFVEGRPVQIDDIEEHDRTVYRAMKSVLLGFLPEGSQGQSMAFKGPKP